MLDAGAPFSRERKSRPAAPHHDERNGALATAPEREPASRDGDGESEVDFTALQERRAYLGDVAEGLAPEAEQKRLRTAGRADLASAVHVVSADHRLGYDIASFDADGTPRHIEVKAASGSKTRMEFYRSGLGTRAWRRRRFILMW